MPGRRGVAGALAALVITAGSLLALPGAANAASTGDVYVVNGLAGSTADILVDDNNVAPKAAPKTVVGPLRLSPGPHVLSLKDGDQALVTAQFKVTAGTSTDVVAHRTADAGRTPVVTVFPNELRGVAPGKTRLVVAHVAVAPPADIRVDGTPMFRNVASGEALTLELPARTASLDIVPTATSGPAILNPVKLTLKAGTLTRVFAIGDATSGTTDAIVQELPIGVVGSQRPIKVATGDGGQAADSFVGSGPSLALWVLLVGGLGLLGMRVLNRRTAAAQSVIGSRHAR